MASPARIREALEKLFGAKKANEAAQVDITDQLKGGNVARVDADIAQARATDLTRKRAEAQRVQDVDPLTEKFPGEEIFPGDGEPDYLHRYVRNRPERDPSRLPGGQSRKSFDPGQRGSPEEITESDYFINEFERLTNRTPTPEELADPEGIRRVVEVLQQGDANIGRLDLDDVPF